MGKCTNCGKDYPDLFTECPYCESVNKKDKNTNKKIKPKSKPKTNKTVEESVNKDNLIDIPPITNNSSNPNFKDNVNDKGEFKWALCGCCLPLVGFILWALWRKEKPNTAKILITASLVSFIICTIIIAVSFTLSFSGSLASFYMFNNL